MLWQQNLYRDAPAPVRSSHERAIANWATWAANSLSDGSGHTIL
jgi:hypothetical protein